MDLQQPQIHPSAFVADNASVYGDVTVEEDCSIWFHSTVRGDAGTIRIGKGSNVQDNCVLHTNLGYVLEIGENVTIGHNAIVHGCRIGDHSLVGMGAIILNGAVIGKNCVIGAGALVTQNKVIPDNSLVLGSPGKVVREVTEEEKDKSLINARYYTQHGYEYRLYFENLKSGRVPEKVIHMNMCMVKRGDEVLALDKVNSSYTGTTFPGGHVQPKESFHDAVVREIKEETGLTIQNPKLKGLYHWYKNGVHNMGYLYLAEEFTGELKASEEGHVYWIPLEEFKKKPLANGMESVLKILESDSFSECYMEVEGDGSETEQLF